jgi:hypothetical protein
VSQGRERGWLLLGLRKKNLVSPSPFFTEVIYYKCEEFKNESKAKIRTIYSLTL